MNIETKTACKHIQTGDFKRIMNFLEWNWQKMELFQWEKIATSPFDFI